MYTWILDEHLEAESHEGLEQLELVLELILGTEEPIFLRTISELIPRDLSDPNPTTNLGVVRHLTSLLVNTHDVDRPMSPFHTYAKRRRNYLVDLERDN
jgi:hypothetical protein